MRVSKMTSQRTGPWNVARRQLAKGDFGVCEICILFYVVARRELLQQLSLKQVRYICLNQVGIRGNTMIKC